MNNIYSNNVNVPLTPFVFDRVYENPTSLNAKEDGVLLGRYVLLKYDNQNTLSEVYQKQYVDNELEYILVAKFYLNPSPIAWKSF
jgi:hypothetical protein